MTSRKQFGYIFIYISPIPGHECLKGQKRYSTLGRQCDQPMDVSFQGIHQGWMASGIVWDLELDPPLPRKPHSKMNYIVWNGGETSGPADHKASTQTTTPNCPLIF